MSMEPKWLEWSQALQGLAQTGLTYAQHPADRERYEKIHKIAAEIMSTGSGTDMTRILDLFGEGSGYATPKISVRAAVFRDDGILMVRETDDGFWSLPGGFADIGDSPAEAIEREIREESGYQARATKLIYLLDGRKHRKLPRRYHIYTAYFRCEIIGGDADPGWEASEVGFFREEELPELSPLRMPAGVVPSLFRHLRDPDLAADFD